MAADKNITIKFLAKGDDKLIKAFKNLATSQKKFNNTSDNTTKSTSKVNASFQTLALQVKNTVGSFKKLDVSQATINKAMKGNKVAIDKVRQAMKRLDAQNGKTRKGARLLDNTFATLRSKMLLFSFAMSLGGRQIAMFAQEAAKVQDMERAFTNLSGGAEKASIAVDKLGAATNGTMSKFDLFQQANNAMILGVSKNSDEMARMFDVAQRLGAALGKDTKHSVESLITGIGRQSRLMLDNIGIIVKSDEAYQAYAAELGISADKLSDAEKKQAFLNATMEAAEKKLLDVGDEVLSYNAKLQIAGARMADAGVAIGNVLLPALASLALFFTDTDNIRRFTTALLGLGAGIAFVNRKAIQARISVIAMNMSFKMSRAALIASGWGVAVLVLGELAAKLLTTKEANDGLTGSWKRTSVAMSPILFSYKKLIDQKDRLIKATKDEMAVLDVPSPLIESMSTEERLAFEKRARQDQAIEDARARRAEESEIENQRVAEEFSREAELARKVEELRRAALERYEEGQKKIKELNKERIKSEKEATKAIVSSSFSQAMAYDNAGEAAQAAVRDVISAKIQSMIASLMEDAIAKFGWLGIPLAATAGAVAGSLVGQAQRHWKMDKFEDGGLVGGRRHSQGGTMIEAEQGEFVMSRNAVNAVGIEAMNRINAGGGAGSVNVSFAGNVMSQDFIEDEAIPMIKEAIRRGADIGVS